MIFAPSSRPVENAKYHVRYRHGFLPALKAAATGQVPSSCPVVKKIAKYHSAVSEFSMIYRFDPKFHKTHGEFYS
jgi:hypothetical protein